MDNHVQQNPYTAPIQIERATATRVNLRRLRRYIACGMLAAFLNAIVISRITTTERQTLGEAAGSIVFVYVPAWNLATGFLASIVAFVFNFTFNRTYRLWVIAALLATSFVVTLLGLGVTGGIYRSDFFDAVQRQNAMKNVIAVATIAGFVVATVIGMASSRKAILTHQGSVSI